MSYPSHLTPGAVDFIKRALVRSPETRTNMTELLAHTWLRSHMRRAAVPHIRSRAQTQGEVTAGLGMLGPGSGGVASCSGGGAGAHLGSAGGPGSLSVPGTVHGGGSGGVGVGGWGGARMQSSGGIAKGGLVAGGLAGGASEGHNSSCPNILHAQVGGMDRGNEGGWSFSIAKVPLSFPLSACKDMNAFVQN